MRPDEHKQKKSKQYQAKQVAKGKAPAQGAESKDADKGKGKKPPPSTGQKAQAVPDKRKEQLPASSQAGPPRVPDVEGEEGEERRSFSRRKIESNTYRYDNEQVVDSDEELVVDEHGSLKALLQEAGPLDVSARFQLREEREWEDGTDNNGPLHLLSVDCADLARALRCIPLAERLGLDTSFFEPEALRQQQQQAHEHRQAWLLAHPPRLEPSTAPGRCVSSRSESAATEATSQPAARPVAEHPPEPTHTATQSSHMLPPQQPQKQPLPHVSAQAHTQAGTHMATPPTAHIVPAVSTNTNAPAPTPAAELEDDLDALLGIQPAPKIAATVAGTRPQGGGLDSFPMPTPQPNTTPLADVDPVGKGVGGAGPGQSEGAKADDLEDWLDSVLDD